jgi:hypothetical protein
VYKHCWKRESRSWENNYNGWQTKTMVGVASTIVGRVKACRSWENNNNGWQTKTIVGEVSTIVRRVKAAPEQQLEKQQ